MKIQICSDLHLEFPENRAWLKEHPLIPKGDILIIAGDVYYLNGDYNALTFIDQVSANFEQTYIIPGNHEYYDGFDVGTAKGPMELQIRDNVRVLNNTCVEIEGTTFIFSTLWSKIEKHGHYVRRGMADFFWIQYEGKPFRVHHFNELHDIAFDFIEQASKKEGRKIVVTHHLPSSHCNLEIYKDSLLNEAFCIDKTTFIEQSSIDYWIYGHSHGNKDDFEIGGTTMVTNQLGYVGQGEHKSFLLDKVIEVK